MNCRVNQYGDQRGGFAGGSLPREAVPWTSSGFHSRNSEKTSVTWIRLMVTADSISPLDSLAAAGRRMVYSPAESLQASRRPGSPESDVSGGCCALISSSAHESFLTPHAAVSSALSDNRAPEAPASVQDNSGAPAFRDILRAATAATLASLPSAVAIALANCETAIDAAAHKDYQDQSVLHAVESLQRLTLQVEPAVYARIDSASEIADSRRFLKNFLLPTDNPPDLAARGQKILDRLEQESPSSLHGRVAVLDGPSLEAFSRGGENVIIGRDVLDLPEDESAAILAHERAHLLERHILEIRICNDVANHIAAAFSHSSAASAAVRTIGKLATAGLQRDQEFCADSMAAAMLRRAGYDPSAMQKVLKRLQGDAQERESPLDDHPLISARIGALNDSVQPG